jgi:hypothetical protein
MRQGIERRLWNSLGTNVTIIVHGNDFNRDTGAISDFFLDPWVRGVREFEVTKVTSNIERVGGIYTCSIILLYTGGILDPAYVVENAPACDDLCFEGVSDCFDIWFSSGSRHPALISTAPAYKITTKVPEIWQVQLAPALQVETVASWWRTDPQQGSAALVWHEE